MQWVWLWTAVVAAALAILQGVLAGMQTWEHRRFARSRLRSLRRQTQCLDKGRAVVIIPCRGLDAGIEENIERLFFQDYPNYEVWFVVESDADPVFPLLLRLTRAHPKIASRIIQAGSARESSQKVHNLRVATGDLPETIQYLAFLDADARPAPHWLRSLLTRVDLKQFGAATGYRWYVPERASLANHLLYSLNCSIATLYSRNGPNFIWGGSWAIRRDRFEHLGIRDAWKGTLSDDFLVSRVIHRAGLQVQFEPACMVASPVDVSLAGMIEFVRRQYIIGRVYVPHAFLLGLGLITFSNLAMLGSLGLAAWGAGVGVVHPGYPLGVAAILYLTTIYRGLVRSSIAADYCPEQGPALRAASRFDTFAGPLASLVNWLALLASSRGRQLTWRRIAYRLGDSGRVASIHRLDEPGASPPLPCVPPVQPCPTEQERQRRAA